MVSEAVFIKGLFFFQVPHLRNLPHQKPSGACGGLFNILQMFFVSKNRAAPAAGSLINFKYIFQNQTIPVADNVHIIIFDHPYCYKFLFIHMIHSHIHVSMNFKDVLSFLKKVSTLFAFPLLRPSFFFKLGRCDCVQVSKSSFTGSFPRATL